MPTLESRENWSAREGGIKFSKSADHRAITFPAFHGRLATFPVAIGLRTKEKSLLYSRQHYHYHAYAFAAAMERAFPASSYIHLYLGTGNRSIHHFFFGVSLKKRRLVTTRDFYFTYDLVRSIRAIFSYNIW